MLGQYDGQRAEPLRPSRSAAARRCRHCSEPKQAFRILVEQLSLDLPVGRQAADTRDDLGAQTVRSAPVAIVAVAAEKQLVAMPRQEIAREILVARQRVEP